MTRTTIRSTGTRGLVLLLSAAVACFAATAEAAPQKALKKAAKGGASKGKYGAAVVFPAKGNFDPDKGTLEAVFSLSYSFGDKMGQGSSISTFSLLSLSGRKGSGRGEQGASWHVSIGQYQGHDHLTMSSTMFELARQYDTPVTWFSCSLAPTNSPPFKAGEWRSLAASWQRIGDSKDKYALALYLDGKCVRKGTMPVSPMFGTSEIDPKDLLCFGNPWLMRGSLECLRLSKRVRTPDEIAAAHKDGLVKDADTRVFLDAETVAKLKIKAAEDLINREEKTIRVPPEGLLFGDLEYVPGRKGKAIKFPD